MGNKLFTYMVVIVTIWAILFVMGESLSGTFFKDNLGLADVDSLADIQGSKFWAYMILTFASLAGGTVLLSFFTKNISALPATALLASGFVMFIIIDMIHLIQLVSEPWMKSVLFLIIAPLTAGFIIAIWDWVRGID